MPVEQHLNYILLELLRESAADLRRRFRLLAGHQGSRRIRSKETTLRESRAHEFRATSKGGGGGGGMAFSAPGRLHWGAISYPWSYASRHECCCHWDTRYRKALVVYMTGWPTDAQQPEFFENQIPDSYEAKKIVAEAHGAKGY